MILHFQGPPTLLSWSARFDLFSGQLAFLQLTVCFLAMEDTPYESKLVAPTWLSGAVVRPPPASASPASSLVNERRNDGARNWCGCEPGAQCVQCSFLHLQSFGGAPAAGGADVAPSSAGGNAASSGLHPWLSSAAMVMATKVNSLQAPNSAADMMMGRGPKSTPQQQGGAGIISISHGRSTPDTTQSPAKAQSWHGRPVRLLDLQSDTANSSDLVEEDAVSAEQQQQKDNQSIWQSARLKTDISMHPLYDRLLEAHVACLRIATPSDQLLRIDAQIAQAPQIISKYAVPGHNRFMVGEEKEELDQFMTQYVLLLYTFKEKLDEHVRGHAVEAVMACWALEKSLLTLTGVSPGEGTGATMSDDDDDPGESDPSIYDTGFDGHDSGAYGPLVPTETERSLMERVRQELKSELKTGYKDRIADVREEILRKRRAGKLPGDTTSVLKTWWQTHSKWPYPTEDEKARLVEETGLQLKQINNWFINQRKRNWHSNPSSAAALKTKRKR